MGRTRAFFATRSIGTSIYRQRLIRPEPHSRHSSQHPAPSWFSATRSSILRAAQLHIRHIVPWPALTASSELVRPSTSRPAQQTCPSACPCPGSSPITRRFADRAHPGGGLNRPACARPVAGAAALYCAQQGSLVSRLVTTGWAVLASSQPRDFARDDVRLFRDAKYGLAPV